MQQGTFDWGSGDKEVPADTRMPWLRAADPARWKVGEDWRPLLERFWKQREGQKLLQFLQQRLSEGAVIYPPEPLHALSQGGPAHTRVVILGQDPYHGPGQAEGLAFSVAEGVQPPPSLRNIYKELRRDMGVAMPREGSLLPWVGQGVLLLNTCLTVEDGKAGSHAGQGWEALTDAVIEACNGAEGSRVFMLWGNHAQKKRELIDTSRHLVLCANHPSPLSASRGNAPFLGCGHFSEANRWLASKGREPVHWSPGAQGDERVETMA